MKKTKRQFEGLNLPPDRKNDVRTIIANLIGMADGVLAMGDAKLSPDILPKDMVFEHAVLRALYHCDSQGIEPVPQTIENIIKYDEVLTNYNISERLQSLISYRTEPPEVKGSSFGLKLWVEKAQVKQVIDNKMAAMDAYISPVDFYREILVSLSGVAPSGSAIESISGSQLSDLFEADLQNRWNIIQSGILPGPAFPYPALQKFVEYQEPGEMTSITLLSKGGKTAIAHDLASHVAYEQPGYNSLFIHVETRAIILRRRAMVREFLIPGYAFKYMKYYGHNGEEIPILEDKRYLKMQAEYNAYVKEREQMMGALDYVHYPGATITDIDAIIETHRIKAEMQGRKLSVYMDYLQAMGHEKLDDSDETAKNNDNANRLLDTTKKHDVYMTVMVQDATNPDYSLEEPKPYAGMKIIQRSQVNIQIQRKRAAENDESVRHYPNKSETMHDFTGAKVYWHKGGQWHSDLTWYFYRTNDGQTGKVKMKMCNAFYDMVDPNGDTNLTDGDSKTH